MDYFRDASKKITASSPLISKTLTLDLLMVCKSIIKSDDVEILAHVTESNEFQLKLDPSRFIMDSNKHRSAQMYTTKVVKRGNMLRANCRDPEDRSVILKGVPDK